ncbi:MAG: hypothetical protein ABWY11_01715 [Umezawaea sp.]
MGTGEVDDGTAGNTRPAPDADRAAVEHAVDVFFAAFTSGPDCHTRIQALRALFLPQAVIVRTCGLEPEVYGVEEFLAPRERVLTDGTLTDFREWPLRGRVEVFGDIAHWFGAYAKQGLRAGEPFTGRGMKTVQLIRTAAGWRITAAAWDDERADLALPPPGGDAQRLRGRPRAGRGSARRR